MNHMNSPPLRNVYHKRKKGNLILFSRGYYISCFISLVEGLFLYIGWVVGCCWVLNFNCSPCYFRFSILFFFFLKPKKRNHNDTERRLNNTKFCFQHVPFDDSSFREFNDSRVSVYHYLAMIDAFC